MKRMLFVALAAALTSSTALAQDFPNRVLFGDTHLHGPRMLGWEAPH